MSPGAVFTFPIGDEQRGLGQVLAVDGDAVAVALCAAVWDCEPLLDDLADAPIGLRIRVKRARLEDSVVLGNRPVEGAAEGAVVDAPLAVLVRALA